jgi:ABC-type multidrug transport system fused ATPase/permease subunit
MKKLKQYIDEVIYISKVTKVTKKKIRLLFSVLLSNVTVFFDILIILVFAFLLGGDNNEESIYFIFIKIVIDNIYLLPLIVIFRTIVVLIEKVNIHDLQLHVERNLKSYVLTEVYKKGNYSIADATFYTNALSGHLSYFYGALAGMLNNIIQIIVYSSFLVYTDFKTLSAFALGGLILFFPTRYLLLKSRKYMHESWEYSQEVGRDIQRVIQNLFLIKILKKSEFELNLYRKSLLSLQESQFRNLAYGTINSLLPNFLTILTISFLVAFFNFAKVITLEFLGITLRLVQTIGNTNQTLNMLVNSSVHIEKFMEFEENKLHIIDDYYSVNSELSNAVELSNINFKYFNSDEFIFKNLNLNIKKGKHTVITGANGAGKSTFLGIISQIFYPESGTIDIFTNKIGYVGVTPLIIDGTLKQNLLYGSEEKSITDKELIDTLKTFNLFKNDNYDLEFKITNRTLSSGQMQKISFMRALLANAELLLLDESTSNLDAKTRDMIFEILKTKEITIINSTHNYQEFDYDHHINIEYQDENRIFVELT